MTRALASSTARTQQAIVFTDECVRGDVVSHFLIAPAPAAAAAAAVRLNDCQ